VIRSPKQSAVYWFNPEPSEGSEFKKIRPCIVVSPNDMNENLRTVLVVPLTTAIKPWPFRINVEILGRQSSAACDQLRVIDKNRLKDYISDLKPVDKDNLYSLLQTILSE